MGRREEARGGVGGGKRFTADYHSPVNPFMEAADLIKVNEGLTAHCYDNQQTHFDGLRKND